MSKAIKTALMLFILYVVPLLGNPLRIIHLQILVLMLACAVLFWTQPELNISEGQEHQQEDQHSYYAILIVGPLSQIISVILWGYWHDGTLPPSNWKWVALGFLMMTGGLIFRIWSIRTLGEHFTAAVQTSDQQELITTGPYAIIRHPSYLGAYLAIIGSAIFLCTPLGTLVSIAAMSYAYERRISAEEKALAARFGESWQAYKAHTFRMLPYVW